MVALITIMAQSGCFVPAEQAYMPLRKHIFSRLQTCDNIARNASTFTVEMEETAYILQNCTSESLVIIDELGRGTSYADGLALAWSVCEALLVKGPMVFFTTHYDQLCELSSMYSNVRNYHFPSKVRNLNRDLPCPTYTLQNGPSPAIGTYYGIQMAQLCGFPQNVIETAKNICKKIQNSSESHSTNGTGSSILHPSQDIILRRILSLRYSGLSTPELRQQLHQIASSMQPPSSSVSVSPVSSSPPSPATTASPP